MKTIGDRILVYRKRAGLSQEELAFRAGVSRQTVSKWEMNATQPSAENIKALSVIFQVSADRLLLDEVVDEEIIREAVISESPAAYAKKNRTMLWLIMGASIIFSFMVISITLSFLIGYSLFSSNLGDDYLSTSQLDVSLFFIAVVFSVMLLLGEIIVVFFIAKRKKDM